MYLLYYYHYFYQYDYKYANPIHGTAPTTTIPQYMIHNIRISIITDVPSARPSYLLGYAQGDNWQHTRLDSQVYSSPGQVRTELVGQGGLRFSLGRHGLVECRVCSLLTMLGGMVLRTFFGVFVTTWDVLFISYGI